MTTTNAATPAVIPGEDMDPKFIEESLGTIGGLFGEKICHQVWVDANKSPTPTGSGFNKRLIVVGKYKMLSLKKGAFGKSVELEFHLYNISEINYVDNDETISIRYVNPDNLNDNNLGITVKASLEKLQHLVRAVRMSYRAITCGFTPDHMFKLNFPENKLLDFDTPLEMSPANGYVDTYIAHSYFYKTVSTLDFIRYIEALVQNESHELDFTQCPGIDPTSEICFNLFTSIASLRHNTYFRSIDLSGLPHANIISALGMCLETNRTLTKLNLSNLRIEQSFQPLANGLAKNPLNKVQVFDFSKNSITYPVMITLCDLFSRLQHGLVSLDLSKCELQPKTVVILFESFERNFGASLALKYLNLSHNKLGDLGSGALASWMSKIKGYHSLQNLVLANCSLNFTIMGPPLRVIDIPRLDLSNNQMNRASSKLLANEVFDCITTLTELNMSNCGLNSDMLEDIFVALNRNRKIAHFSINLSRNNLGAREATVLAKSISGCRYLEALDISHNKLTCKSLMELVNALKNIDQFNLHELNIGNNYFAVGPEGDQLAALLAQFVQNFPAIRTLNIAGGRYPLGKSLFPLFEAMVKNASLRELDISENGLTDSMSSVIGEMLRTNSTLVYLNLDNNMFGLQGWSAIAQPLLFDINRTLQHLVMSKTLASAYTSTLIQNFTQHQAFGTMSKSKREHLISLFLKMQDKLAENRFEASLDSNSYVSEYANRQGYQVPLSSEVVAMVPVPEHLSSLPLPPSPQPEQSPLQSVSKLVNSSTSTLTNLTINGINGINNLIGNEGKSPMKSHKKQDSTSSNSSLNLNGATTAIPPMALPTQSSDWQPDDNSEFEPFESNTSSFVNYSSNSDYSDEDESADEKRKRRSHKKSSKQNQQEGGSESVI